MEQVQTDFGLGYDEAVIARVRAVNAAGLSSEWGESADDEAFVKTKPQ